MEQIWQDQKVVPVTVIAATPNTVSLIRSLDRDHYSAVQLSLGKVKKEFRVKEDKDIPWQKGETVTVQAFQVGDKVKVSGLSKGRGFQGVVKRHGFHGGPKTHGQKNRYRHPGSIGSTAPQKVFPGRRMAGRMGQEQVSLRNLKVVQIDADKNLLWLKGAVPGSRGSLLVLRKEK